MLRTLPLVMALAGCTFYISADSGDAGGGSAIEPDAFVDGDDAQDAPSDTTTPPIDAPVDSLFPFDVNIPPIDAAPVMPLETLMVPCTGQVVTSQLTYSSALTYRVRASGQCKVDVFLGADVMADAEYYGTTVPRDRESGVDVGLGLYDTTLGFDTPPAWGFYNSNHVYEVTGPGFDVPVAMRFHDKANNAYGNNSGMLTVEIFLQ